MISQDNNLYVITPIINPIRFESRYKLYKNFAEHMENSNAKLYTIEAAFGDRSFVVTNNENPQHIQVRTEHELWYKENMINLAMSRLPQSAKYIAWIDADIQFTRKDWVNETIQQLQHYCFIQLFSHATDLGPNYEPLTTHKGFIYNYHNDCDDINSKSGYHHWHPSYAWASTRESLDHVGG